MKTQPVSSPRAARRQARKALGKRLGREWRLLGNQRLGRCGARRWWFYLQARPSELVGKQLPYQDALAREIVYRTQYLGHVLQLRRDS